MLRRFRSYIKHPKEGGFFRTKLRIRDTISSGDDWGRIWSGSTLVSVSMLEELEACSPHFEGLDDGTNDKLKPPQ